MHEIKRSAKLDNVRYDIRGLIASEAKRLEDAGHKILKLNIGNPGAFDFEAPEDILRDVVYNLPKSQGYSDSKGIQTAREAVAKYFHNQGVAGVGVDDIYIGNGVSELIVMSMQALLNTGDEVLLPAPDYPLWTASITLAGGTPIHYKCEEENDWFPSIDDIKSKINDNTKAIVLINPNNPTGAVYSKEVLLEIVELARKHKLIIFSDEIYDKILYDDAVHIPIASLADDLFIITMGGLSKNFLVAGFRTGWMVLSGKRDHANDYIEGLNLLSSMRLCSNVPSQHAIITALGGHPSTHELTVGDGRLKKQRDLAFKELNAIDGVSCKQAMGALYLFVKVDLDKFNIKDDEKMILDILKQEHILLVHGRAFNIKEKGYFRVVFLPNVEDLTIAFKKLKNFFSTYSQ
ncbi:MAG: pyridoxal phosphate-dependent aminotransferase [Balneolaceae bacterium]